MPTLHQSYIHDYQLHTCDWILHGTKEVKGTQMNEWRHYKRKQDGHKMYDTQFLEPGRTPEKVARKIETSFIDTEGWKLRMREVINKKEFEHWVYVSWSGEKAPLKLKITEVGEPLPQPQSKRIHCVKFVD